MRYINYLLAILLIAASSSVLAAKGVSKQTINSIQVDGTSIYVYGRELLKNSSDRVFFATESSSEMVEVPFSSSGSDFIEVILPYEPLPGIYRLGIGKSSQRLNLSELITFARGEPAIPTTLFGSQSTLVKLYQTGQYQFGDLGEGLLNQSCDDFLCIDFIGTGFAKFSDGTRFNVNGAYRFNLGAGTNLVDLQFSNDSGSFYLSGNGALGGTTVFTTTFTVEGARGAYACLHGTVEYGYPEALLNRFTWVSDAVPVVTGELQNPPEC